METWEALKELGFEEDSTPSYSERPNLALFIGPQKLKATWSLKSWLSVEHVVFIQGLFSSPRTIADVQVELSTEIGSVSQCAACVVYEVEKQIVLEEFAPGCEPWWWDLGRRNRDTVPEVVARKAYDARPHCYVERDWLRLALRDLRLLLATTPPDSAVRIAFDGSVLTFRVGERAIPMPATGAPWIDEVQINSQSLTQLPTRLMRCLPGVEFWEGHLVIANHRYSGACVVQPGDQPR